MPWPALQRRRIEKLKDDRLHEFERACGESFEWLENYYQGCVYAALQNTDYHETAGGGEAERAFTRSISTDHGRQSQHFTTDQYDEDLLPFSPYASGYYSGQGRSTASPGYHHSLPHQRQQQQRQQHQQQQQRQKARHTPKNSPAKFRLKSPKTPNVARIGSPTSPYDRQHHQHRHTHTHIHTTPRKKLRVTARPSSMRAQRALKAMRKRTASFQKGSTRHRDSKMDQQQHEQQHQQQQQQHPQQQQQHENEQDQHRVLETEEMSRRDISSVPPKQPQQPQQENSRHLPLESTHKLSSYQDMVTQSRHTPTTPAEDRSFTSDADKSFTYERGRSFTSENGRSFIAELRASTFKTPAKGQSSREIRSSYSQARATHDMEVDSNSEEYQSMPGSKARDSMTLKSPVNRSDISMDQDMESPLRASLSHSAARNRTSSSVAKRSSDLMESDQDRSVDAESKRPKSSPFMDALIPIRSHSPETESPETTKANGLRREGRTKFSDSMTTAATATMTKSQSAERSFSEIDPRWREPDMNAPPTKNRESEPNDRLPARSTTPSTTPHQRYGHSSSFLERPNPGSEDSTHGVQDESSNAGPSRSHVNGDSIEHRPNGASSAANQRLHAESTVRRQADQSDRLNLPGNHQDDRSWRQTDRKEEINTLPTARTGRSAAEEEAEQNPRFKPVTSRANSTAISSSYISTSSDTGALRSNKVTMTLPEKRTLGPRRPATTSSHTGTAAFMLPSRLTKQAPTGMPNVAGSATESQSLPTAMQSDNSTAFRISSSSRMARVGSQSTLKDTQTSGQSVGVGPNGLKSSAVTTSSSNSTSGLLGRQGAPSRPPLASNRAAVEGSGVNSSTGTSLSRPDNQGPLPPRKPFALSTTTTATTTSTAKSVFSLKKPTIRPALPDGVSSVHLVSSSSALARPPGSSLAMMQARIDQHAREPTPTRDIHSKATATQRTELNPTTSASTSTLSLSSVISSRKESLSIAANGVKAETRVESTQSVSKTTKDSGHVFAVPGPVRHQPSVPSWMSNASQTDRNPRPFKTILPEINSDEEDQHHDESGMTRTRRKTAIPEWASWEELNRAMDEQKHWNPEEIFGQLPLLDMAEIFPGKEKKSYRSRSSSAHWGASDALTPQEVNKYNQDMGWTGKE